METRFWKSWRLFALTFLACLNGWSGHGVVFAKPQFESTQPRLLRDALQMAGDPEGLSGTGDPANGFFPAQVAAEVRLNFLNANSRRAFVVADPAGRDKPRDVGPRFSFNSSRRFAANLRPTLANAHSAPSSLRLTTHRMKESKIGESPRAQAPVTKFHFQIENTG